MATIYTSPVKDALKLAIIQQVAVLVLTGFMLDGGGLFLVAVFAFTAFWAGTALIILRHRQISTIDVLVLKWGFFPLCVASFFLARWIWALRGYAS